MPKPPFSLYFNENEPFVGQWLKNLWPKSTVDMRSVVDVSPEDVVRYKRVHLFAGIGGWEYALTCAGWPWQRQVWTGSCPCQPFSQAGKRKGTADKRHLWPEFFRLIRECRPATVFGEQVASKLGREWLAGVRSDLEGIGYAVGAADLPAACVGAPHIRQRLWWVASKRLGNTDANERDDTDERQAQKAKRRKDNAKHPKRRRAGQPSRASDTSRRLDYPNYDGGKPRDNQISPRSYQQKKTSTGSISTRGSNCFGVWSPSLEIWDCAGRRYRISVEPKFFPLAHRVPNRVGRLRAYGNAIVPQVAVVFIRSFMEVEDELLHQSD